MDEICLGMLNALGVQGLSWMNHLLSCIVYVSITFLKLSSKVGEVVQTDS